MRVADFHFPIPPELIAQRPPAQRDAARMLTVDRSTGNFADRRFTDLPSLLHPGDLLILNDSRVIPARLYARRTGLRTQTNSPAPTGLIEVLLTRQLTATDWRALVKPGRKVQPGEVLSFVEHSPKTRSFKTTYQAQENMSVSAENHEGYFDAPEPVNTSSPPQALGATILTAGDHGERTLRFTQTQDFYSHLDRLGHIPLPPYLHRPDTPADRDRYQTVFAGTDTHGSAAAPTAGLHFTPAILQQLHDKGVEIHHVTLHVGLGTFQPVRVDRTEDIRLHAEPYTLSVATAEALNRARRDHRRITAAGTTVVRTLEHCAAHANADPSRPLLGNTQQRELRPHTGETGIFLSPGHTFRMVDALLTNFHLPQSTLLMLVCAFAGTPQVLAAYHHAVAHRYRFFSYGDCMFLA